MDWKVGDRCDPRDARQHLLENFDTLALRAARRGAKPRHVLRWAILVACNRQRIAGGGHHYGYGLSGGARGQRRGRSPRHDDVYLQAHQFVRQFRETRVAATRRTIFQGEVLPLGIATVEKRLLEDGKIDVALAWGRVQKPDAITSGGRDS
jgi:hypothetical protein